jgi:hypothetical protein
MKDNQYITDKSDQIKKLSQKVDKVVHFMQRCRIAFKRASKVRKIFNI